MMAPQRYRALPESEAESSRRRATLSIATLLLLVALCALFGATQLRRDGSASRGGTSSLAASAAASAVGGEEGWEAGQRNPHPWQHDRKSTTIDSQKDSGLNCLDPTASAVLGGVDVVAYWSADERANATYGFANNSLSWFVRRAGVGLRGHRRRFCLPRKRKTENPASAPKTPDSRIPASGRAKLKRPTRAKHVRRTVSSCQCVSPDDARHRRPNESFLTFDLI